MNNMNLSTYLGLAFVASLQSATVQQELVRHHTGAPLQVVAIGCGPDELLRQLVIVNVSDKVIRGAQAGWFVADKGAPSKSVAFSGLPFDLNLAPGDFVVVGRQGASISSIKATMQSLGSDAAKVKPAIIYVKFADGSDWQWSMIGKTAFDEKFDAAVAAKEGPALQRYETWRANKIQALRAAPAAPPAQASLWDNLRNWFRITTVHAQGFTTCDPGNGRCDSINDCDGNFGGCCTRACLGCPSPQACGLQIIW